MCGFYCPIINQALLLTHMHSSMQYWTPPAWDEYQRIFDDSNMAWQSIDHYLYITAAALTLLRHRETTKEPWDERTPRQTQSERYSWEPRVWDTHHILFASIIGLSFPCSRYRGSLLKTLYSLLSHNKGAMKQTCSCHPLAPFISWSLMLTTTVISY